MAKNIPAPKDPGDRARFWYDFEPLLADDEAIVGTPVVTVLTDADELPLGAVEVIGKTVFVWVEIGGVLGKSYPLEFVFNTSEGQTFNRTAVLKVKDL